MKEKRAITCGIFYCRDSAEIKGCGSHQTSLWLDSDVLRNRQQNIPLSVMGKANLQKKLIIKQQNLFYFVKMKTIF